MTPAINLLNKFKISHHVHQYEHDHSNSAYGLEAAQKLALSPQQVFKTLVVQLDNQKLAVAVLPVSGKLSMKLMAKACGAKKAEMADAAIVQRVTGYVLGGVSPLGQKKRLKTIIHASVQDFDEIFVSAGRRGLDIELSPDDLKVLCGGIFSEIIQQS